MLIRTVLHVSLCMLLAQHITGEPQNIDGLQNEDIVLCPTFSGELEDITWKLGNNKIAEYDSFKIKMFYGDFKKETELNITSGCLKMNYITDRRDGLYTAELQIGGQLQYHMFKLKVYRPVSKPNVTCSVTDSNVTLLCEGDESLGDQYRWEVLENQVRRGTTNGKNLTFSKEENHNIEYTCIFSNLKSEERSDPIKNCFVPGGHSHIWVPILVLLAVAGLIALSYKCYSKSQVLGTHGNSMAGHNGTRMDFFIRKQQGEQINETAPFIKTNQLDSENKPGPEVMNVKDKKKIFEGAPEGEAALSPAPRGEAPLSPTPRGEAPLSAVPQREDLLSPAPEGEALLSPAPEGEAPLSPAPQGEAPLSSAPEGEAPLSPAPQGEAPLSSAPEGEAPLSPAPQGEAPLSSAPEGEAPLSPAPQGEAPLSSAPEGEAALSSAPEREVLLSPAPQREAPLSPVPQREDLLSSVAEGEAPLSSAPEGEATLSSAPEREDLLSPAPQGEAPLSPVPQREDLLSSVAEGEALLSPAPQREAPLSPVPQREDLLSPAPQGEAPLSPVPQREDLLSSAPEGEAPLSPAPQGEAPLSPAPQGEAPLSPAPQGEAQLSPALQDENKNDVTRL